jgi:hypothetical protein
VDQRATSPRVQIRGLRQPRISDDRHVTRSRLADHDPPDNIWFAHWNGLKNTSDQASYPASPNSDWKDHQRPHQYEGNLNQAWGVGISIDADWVDGGVAGTPTLGATPTHPSRVLRNDPVHAVQKGRPAAGFTGTGSGRLQWALKVTADGDFEPRTRAALVGFAKLQKIPANGIANRLVWNRLETRNYPLIAYRGLTETGFQRCGGQGPATRSSNVTHRRSRFDQTWPPSRLFSEAPSWRRPV